MTSHTLDADTFAAERDENLRTVENRLTPPVRSALAGGGTWGGVLATMRTIFAEIIQDEAPGVRVNDAGDEALVEVVNTLNRTKVDDVHFDTQAERITRWLATATVNAAVATIVRNSRGVGVEWVTMLDERVREIHADAHGQRRRPGETFAVGGFGLLYPGHPVGPPEVWINCRCVLRIVEMSNALAASGEETDMTETTVEEPPEVTEADLAIPVPWYGVLAPEETWSGDRRRFAKGALSTRNLPLPLKWMPADAQGHGGSVVVGRIDRVWMEGQEMRAEGVFDSSPHAYEAIRQIAGQMIRGVSVDVDDVEAAAEMAGDPEGSITFSNARVAAATLCAIPAFHEAFVALGYWSDHEERQQVAVDAQMSDLYHQSLSLGLDDAETFIAEGEWDGSASRFTPEQWKRSCVIHVCDGEEKSCHKLPIREPGGALSRAGVHAAAGRLNQVDAPPDQVAAAKRALRSAYRQLGEEPPEVVKATGETETFEVKPGLHKDGTPPVCEFCDKPSTKYVLWAEGMAYVPACDDHIEKAQAAIEDPTDIVRVGEYTTEFVPVRTMDGPGWITHPVPTERITNYWVHGEGAAKIGWGAPGDFSRCRLQLGKYVQNPDWLAGLCANLHYRALHIWPGQHRGELALTAAATEPPPLEWFLDPKFTQETPLTIEGRHVYGHLALWRVCHIGKNGCVKPPRSHTDYSYFRTGAIQTDGGLVSIGQISLGGGHAHDRHGIRATIAHYDSTSTAVADIAVGEDEFGIWFNGRLRDVPEETITELLAASLSGDWRRTPEGFEMVAALGVNVPGFGVPRPSVLRDDAGVYAITAAGIATDEAIAHSMLERVERARKVMAVTAARDALRGEVTSVAV